jgi:hypothetical protein
MHGPICIFWASLTPASLQVQKAAVGAAAEAGKAEAACLYARAYAVTAGVLAAPGGLKPEVLGMLSGKLPALQKRLGALRKQVRASLRP